MNDLQAQLQAHEMSWGVVDPDGVVRRGGKGHNIVLSNAAELLTQFDFNELGSYGAVGTGSTLPALSQTILVAETARTTTDAPGFSKQLSRVSNGLYEMSVGYEFTEAQVGGKNLTEWGFGPSVGVNSSLISRELFRDGSNNPITLSLAADQRLRLIYKYRISIPHQNGVPGSINIANVGVRNGKFYTIGGSSSTFDADFGRDLRLFTRLARGQATTHDALVGAAVLVPNYTDINLLHTGVSIIGGAYTTGTKTRSSGSPALGSSLGNGTIRGFVIGNGGRAGALFAFDAGQEFTKTSLQKLTINPWIASWT
jgi:hypothetical protein